MLPSSRFCRGMRRLGLGDRLVVPVTGCEELFMIKAPRNESWKREVVYSLYFLQIVMFGVICFVSSVSPPYHSRNGCVNTM